MEKGGETTNTKAKAGNQLKRTLLEINDSSDDVSRRRPKRAAACTNFKERSVRISKKSAIVETKKQQIVEDEIVALHMTSLQSDELRQTRRLTDFLLHDTNGDPQPVEMIEIVDIFITGVILPLDECSDKEKEKGVRCQSFGLVESWKISGCEDGSPVIWISTDLADYDCLKPATSYKKMYDYFFAKECASMAVYKKLSKFAGGNPDTSLDELLAAVARSMTGSKCFSSNVDIQDFVIAQGDFIYNQLAGLNETAKINDARFTEIPVLISLRDESNEIYKIAHMEGEPSNGALRIGGVSEIALTSDKMVDCVDKDRRYAKIIQDEEYRKPMQRPRKNNSSAFSSNRFYIKPNEDEIANDYPIPSYYKNRDDETDELILYDDGHVIDTEELPHRMLHNWTLYNYDSRLISLKLLPMRNCANIDVTIFGSGLVAEDDGSGWFCLDDSDTSTQLEDRTGLPIFLSQIKEWMIEYGSMISISLRTDVDWYRLGKPSKQYTRWHESILKTARVATSIITLLKNQHRVARLSFGDVIRRASEFENENKACISSDPSAVERYVVVHGQMILQIFSEYPDDNIKRCAFINGLASKMEERHHTKWVIKKKILQKKLNLNPRAGMGPVASKRKSMQATKTLLIDRVWGEYYSIYCPDDSLPEIGAENGKEKVGEESENEEEDDEEEEEDEEEEDYVENLDEVHTSPKKIRGSSRKMEIRWEGEILGKTSAGELLYRQAFVGGDRVAVGGMNRVKT